MTHAFLDGVGRVAAAPGLVGGVWLLTLVTAAPLGWALQNAIETHRGTGAATDAVGTAVAGTWWEELAAEATGVSPTFTPRIPGLAAVLGTVSGGLDRAPLTRSLVGAIAAYLAIGLFVLGGVLDRLARHRRVDGSAFFAACRRHFLRFCRLAVVAGLGYWWLFSVWHPWLFDELLPAVARDLATEPSRATVRLGAYITFAIPLLLVNLVFDYATIRLVVEGRRSILGALLAAVRFVRRHWGEVLGLYGLNGAVFLAVVASYAWLAPGPAGGTRIWPVVVAGQAYLLTRVAITLVFQASQLAYFQSRLGPRSTPPRGTPSSPATEAPGSRGGTAR